jgi:DNA repair protein SbcC/Rad50
MIEQLELTNFQSWKHGIFKFVPGVNVIIGLSDSGKSAIMNSLNLVMNNQPVGESYRSWWEGDTIVTVDFNDGQISRIRKTGFNGYVLGMHDEFVALKGDVPKEIADFVNMNEVNFQFQLDSHFLLSKSSGEVAKHYNKIAKLDKIDTANANINSWITKIKSDLSHKENDLETNIKKLSTYDYLETFETEVVYLEKLSKKAIAKQNEVETIETTINKINEVIEEISTYKRLAELKPLMEQLLHLKEEHVTKERMYVRLERLITTIEAKQEKVKKYTELLSSEELINDLLQLHSERKEKVKEVYSMGKLIERISVNDEELEYAKKQFTKLHAELERNTPSKCPFCNQTIKK